LWELTLVKRLYKHFLGNMGGSVLYQCGACSGHEQTNIRIPRLSTQPGRFGARTGPVCSLTEVGAMVIKMAQLHPDLVPFGWLMVSRRAWKYLRGSVNYRTAPRSNRKPSVLNTLPDATECVQDASR